MKAAESLVYQPGGVNSTHRDDEVPLPDRTIVRTVGNELWELGMWARTKEGSLMYFVYGRGQQPVGVHSLIFHGTILMAILPDGRIFHWTV